MSAQLGPVRHSLPPCSAPAQSKLQGFRPAQWLAFLRQMLRAVETRAHLEDMDARMLRDIGITKTEASREIARAPWDITAPSRRG